MPNGRCRLHGGFQHTAARRRLDYIQVLTNIHIDSFNTQPPEGGWFCFAKIICLRMGFNTQPPEGGWTGIISIASSHTVSTHSRPKAAGTLAFAGYLKRPVSTHSRPKAAGLWCLFHFFLSVVSTHSRPKAAGKADCKRPNREAVSTHSRPKAAGNATTNNANRAGCFNTQPPEGGWHPQSGYFDFKIVSTHSRPKAAGFCRHYADLGWTWFQHTAARRRLVVLGTSPLRIFGFNTLPPEGGWGRKSQPKGRTGSFNTQPPEGGWPVCCFSSSKIRVSTHSRPKAAGNNAVRARLNIVSFNTQPPEGGWMTYYETSRPDWGFNTQPPEGGWGIYDTTLNLDHLFQHTAARRRLDDRSVRPINRSEVSTHSRPKAAG